MSEGPYLFDVGVTALAHAKTPVSDTALTYVRDAITGEIDAVATYVSLVVAHHPLASSYVLSNVNASVLMKRFMDANRVQWYNGINEQTVRGAFDLAGEANIDGWDGYYAQVALEEGVKTVLTLDDDFDRVDGLSVEIILSPAEFADLNEFLGYH
jgi:predicted nucleic acid-binding protein